MYLDVDFSRAESVDQVKIETSYDYNLHSQVIVEAMNEAGKWVAIAHDSVNSVLPVDPQIRRMATQEMAARGVHYLLMNEGGFGADDIAEDPEGWGFTQVAVGYGFRLYRVIP